MVSCLSLDRLEYSCADAKFQLGLSCTVELLIDSRVGAVKDDERASRVREAVESNLTVFRNSKEETQLSVMSVIGQRWRLHEGRLVGRQTYLLGKDVSTKITKGKLESAVGAVD